MKEALNKHIIKMRVGGVPVQSADDCEEVYWLYWIKAVHRCQQAGPQYPPLKERQLANKYRSGFSLDSALPSPSTMASMYNARCPVYHLDSLQRFLKSLTLKRPKRKLEFSF